MRPWKHARTDLVLLGLTCLAQGCASDTASGDDYIRAGEYGGAGGAAGSAGTATDAPSDLASDVSGGDSGAGGGDSSADTAKLDTAGEGAAGDAGVDATPDADAPAADQATEALPADAASEPDAPVVPDVVSEPDGVHCGSMTCSPGLLCCVSGPSDASTSYSCLGSCPDGGIAASCDGPEDCGSGGGICCAAVAFGAGTPPYCPMLGASASCKASCPANVPLQCPANAQVRLCHASSDCAGDPSGFTICCEFAQGGSTVTFCANTMLAAFASQCH
jgi:hypothetical protein